MIYGILFDFGGTLDADGGHWLDRFYRIYEEIGLRNLDKGAIKEAFYFADAQAALDPAMRKALYRDMMRRHVHWQFEKLKLRDPDKETQAADAFVRAAERVLRRNRKALEVLHHAGYRLGVVSNFYGNVETLCREFGYNTYMKVFVDSALVGVSKPDPAIYTLALEKLQLPANQVTMVGDNFDRDIVPAKGLGMRTAWLIGDQKRVCPDSSKVDITLRSLEELPERLKTTHQVHT
jgi:HAD superfamily hydrolase (TIGR01509 family)